MKRKRRLESVYTEAVIFPAAALTPGERSGYNDAMTSVKMPYKTKQQELLLGYLKKTQGTHFTVDDVRSYFSSQQIVIGTATIYRRLERLVSQGLVNKYVIDEQSAACFEYVGDTSCMAEEPHFHLKCELCGALIHLECEELALIQNHLQAEHGFVLNPFRTVFYGVCADCRAAQILST